MTDDPSRSGRPAPAAPPEPPAHPDYEILSELGRGGMGVVYLARHRMTDRREVLKVMTGDLLARPDAAERFLREVRAAARLAHPNIVTLYNAFQVGGRPAFAMEYVDGADLAGVVRAKGPLGPRAACYFAQQAAQGLQHAHEKGMVHRDIKPHNLIVARGGKKAAVKILDFGLAKATAEADPAPAADAPAPAGGSHLTRAGQVLGTPDYIAPEQVTDARAADIRADVYSLGCTLWFLLTGEPPFGRGPTHEILLRHLGAPAPDLLAARPDAPPGLAPVVAKMMAKDPAARYQTPAEVARALDPFVRSSGGGSGADRPAGPPAPGGAIGSRAARALEPAARAAAPSAVFDAEWVSAPETAAARSATRPGLRPEPLLPADDPPGGPPRPGAGAWTWGLVGAGVVAFGLVLFLVGLTAGGRGRGPREVARADPDRPAATAPDPAPPATTPAPPPTKKADTPTPPTGKTATTRTAPPAPPARPPIPVPKDAAFTPLWNGTDLKGWRTVEKVARTWQAVDGVLTANPSYQVNAAVLTDDEYSDFVLRFECVAAPSSSGAVAVRAVEGERMPAAGPGLEPAYPMIRLSSSVGASPYKFGTTHWLADTQATTPPPGPVTGMPNPALAGGPGGRPPAKGPVAPYALPSGWATFELAVRGTRCTMTMEGKPVVDVELRGLASSQVPVVPGLARARGRIGFVVHTGLIQFRKIEVHRLAP